jgi:hypothetical protein
MSKVSNAGLAALRVVNQAGRLSRSGVWPSALGARRYQWKTTAMAGPLKLRLSILLLDPML